MAKSKTEPANPETPQEAAAVLARIDELTDIVLRSRPDLPPEEARKLAVRLRIQEAAERAVETLAAISSDRTAGSSAIAASKELISLAGYTPPKEPKADEAEQGHTIRVLSSLDRPANPA